ncbi:MAG: amidohydrolase family protein [Aggregatilineales bacterium]
MQAEAAPLVIDSHTHAWARWPYQPPAADDEYRGRAEQLLFEMDRHNVAQALVIGAQIERNRDNNAYVAEQVAAYPDRLHQIADIHSFWSTGQHTGDTAAQVRTIAANHPIKGVTFYLDEGDAGDWLYDSAGLQLSQAAADLGLLLSIACWPYQQPAIRKLAEAIPQTPILCHHLGMVQEHKHPIRDSLREVLASAKLPNIYLKVSGFAYSSYVDWDYPYSDVHWLVRALYEHYGPFRLCWGSDYPVVLSYMTYRQAIEVFRTHCTFVPAEHKTWILGKTLAQLLGSGHK